MIKLLRHFHFFYFIFWIFFFSVLLSPFYIVLSKNPKHYLLLNKFRTANAFLFTAIAGVFFKFKFEQQLEKEQTYIYCANHTSNLDIMLFCLLARGRFHFMGKEELLKNPILGLFFKTIDIPVSRSSKISAFKAFKRAGENLENGMSLIIFPEGKIGDEYPPVLNEFKNGPFRLAIEKNIPIVPVSCINMWQIMWDDGLKHGTRPGIGHIYVHKPIITSALGLESADKLKEEVFEKIKAKLITA